MAFFAGVCTKGNMCPYRHAHKKQRVVCKYWYRGMCQNGSECDFLHIYIPSLLPECKFFERDGLSTFSKLKLYHYYLSFNIFVPIV